MRKISVTLQPDHLASLTNAASPVSAVSELIWNGLDADATSVRVLLPVNALGAVDEICVRDNGTGLSHDEAVEAFAKLGGSWKSVATRTKGGRILHGKKGRGRFRAFALGQIVRWSTRYASRDGLLSYEIRGNRSDLKTFEVDDPEPAAGSPGTDVVVSNLAKPVEGLTRDRSHQQLAEEFALYLRQYPRVEIEFDGRRVDPASIEERVTDYRLPPTAVDADRSIEASLTVVEWGVQTSRMLYLCTDDGFTLAQTTPRIHAPGFQFTAYLKSAYLQELEVSGLLPTEDLHPGLAKLLDATRDKLREHFRLRAAEAASSLVEDWKNEHVYPYAEPPKNPIEEAERQVFDLLALNVHSYLPDFGESAAKSKRLTLILIKEAIEANPSAARRIIQEVLDLPAEKQEELVELLERTSLSAIINAARVVTDRLNFLKGLEILVFDPQSKAQLKERSQLHRILAEHTWVFGEAFHLSVDDQSLTEVLRKHRGERELAFTDEAPVLRTDGSVGIIDLMVSRVIPQSDPESRENLIIEIKRPSQKIGDKEAAQVKSYAHAISADERFRDTKTRWVYWVVSNELTDSVRREANQRNRASGILYDDPEVATTVWVKPWGLILQECRARLDFYRKALEYQPDTASALKYLRTAHERYLPASLRES